MRSAVRLLGMDFTDASTASVAALIAERPADAPFGYIVTPNADHFVRLHRHPDLWPLYDHAMVRLLDSRIVAKVARSFGLAAPRVAPGSDLTELLLDRYLTPEDCITIIGLADRWVPALIERYRIGSTAHYDPPRGFERDLGALSAAVEFVLAHPARFVFLAVGSPRQEILADAVRSTGRATGTGFCIGASLDFLAGARRRAPKWMQRIGLEWLHRLGSDPLHMARRYLLDDPGIIPLLLRERLHA